MFPDQKYKMLFPDKKVFPEQKAANNAPEVVPEGHRRNFAHQGIGCDTLQVEQDSIYQQQNDNILVVAEAPPALPNHRHVLNAKNKIKF